MTQLGHSACSWLHLLQLHPPFSFTRRSASPRGADPAMKARFQRLFLPVPFALWWALATMASLLPRPPLRPAQVAVMQRDNVVGDCGATFADLSITPRSAIAMGWSER